MICFKCKRDGYKDNGIDSNFCDVCDDFISTDTERLGEIKVKFTSISEELRELGRMLTATRLPEDYTRFFGLVHKITDLERKVKDRLETEFDWIHIPQYTRKG